jgi:hypothetical protein
VNVSPTEFWIIGGYDGSNYLKSTEICDMDSMSCREYIDVEVTTNRPFAAQITDRYTFLHATRYRDAFIFDLDSETFTSLPDLSVSNIILI